MQTIGVLGRFPGRDYAEILLQALRTRDLEIVVSPQTFPTAQNSGPQSEVLDRLASDQTSLIIVVFSELYLGELSKKARLEYDLIVGILQRSSTKIIPITYESDLALPALLNSLQLYDVTRLGVASLVESVRSRLATFVQPVSRLAPHPKIESAIREGFPGKAVTSVSGPVALRDQSVGYELFRIADRDLGDLYLVHTYEPISIRRTVEHLKSHFGGVMRRPYLVASRDRTATNADVRLSNLKEALDAPQAWYVDAFIAERVGWRAATFLDTIPEAKSYFVEPRVRPPAATSNEAAISYLEQWRLTGNSILVVQGPGGIGKTQLLRKFAREIVTKYEVAVIYLDALSVLDYVRNKSLALTSFDIGMLSEIATGVSGVGAISADRLETLLTSEKFLVILDGLDEIIPRLPTGYEVTEFFSSIQNVVAGLEGGRLLISCRNSFWEPGRIAKPISVVDLEGFDDRQVARYLENRFPNDANRRQQCIRIINDMRKFFTEEIYPFMLDLACRMADTPGQSIADKSQAEKEIFDDGELLDEVLWHVCRREAAKFGADGGLNLEEQPLDVPLQAAFFTELALHMEQLPGDIAPERARDQLVILATGRNISEPAFKAFKSHPLLDSTEDVVRFSYDFIQEFFLALAVKQTLHQTRPVNQAQAMFLTGLCRLESNFLRTVARKVGPLTDEVTLGVAELISVFKSGRPRGEWEAEETWRRSIGGACNIGIQCLIRGGKWDVDVATKYLKDLFGHNNGTELEELVLYAPNSETRVVFSFESTTVRNAEIIDYDNFLRCKFDQGTKFVSSVVFGGKLPPKTAARVTNFDDSCAVEERIRTVIRAGASKDEAVDVANEKILKGFLRMFRSHGTYHRPRAPKTLAGSFSLPTKVSFQRLFDTLEVIGLVEKGVGQGGKFVGITAQAVQEVEDFVEQGVQGPTIRAALAALLKL